MTENRQKFSPGLIFDCHCHVASDKFIPKQFLEGIARNMLKKMEANGMPQSMDRVLSLVSSLYSDHHADGLVKEMDDAGIEHTILLLPDFTFAFPGELKIDDMIEMHAEIKERHKGRFFLFYGVDPRWGKQGLETFETSVSKFGIDGMKIYPPAGYSPSSESLYPYYDICAELGVPVLTHTGPTTPAMRHDLGDLRLVDKAAFDFPNLNFILAHAGVNDVEAGLLACAYRDNVYIDTSGYLGVMSHDGLAGHLKRLFSHGVNHKILFGTDFPVFKLGGNQAKALKQFQDAISITEALSSKDYRMVMWENTMRLLRESSQN